MSNFFVFASHLVTGRVFLKLRHRISRVIDRGYYEVSCSQEAHAHYGDNFTRADACRYFIHGVLSEVFTKF